MSEFSLPGISSRLLLLPLRFLGQILFHDTHQLLLLQLTQFITTSKPSNFITGRVLRQNYQVLVGVLSDANWELEDDFVFIVVECAVLLVVARLVSCYRFIQTLWRVFHAQQSISHIFIFLHRPPFLFIWLQVRFWLESAVFCISLIIVGSTCLVCGPLDVLLVKVFPSLLLEETRDLLAVLDWV